MGRVQVPLILVLSGYDVLEAKLREGISFRNYISSYGNRTNNLSAVTECMSNVCPYSSAIRVLTTYSHRADIRGKFLAISRKVSPEPRDVSVHITKLTVRLFRLILLLKADGTVDKTNDFLQDSDSLATRAVVLSVREGIFRGYLKSHTLV